MSDADGAEHADLGDQERVDPVNQRVVIVALAHELYGYDVARCMHTLVRARYEGRMGKRKEVQDRVCVEREIGSASMVE